MLPYIKVEQEGFGKGAIVPDEEFSLILVGFCIGAAYGH